MFFTAHNHTENFEEEEEEGGIDDALLGELDDDLVDDEELLGAELAPLIKEVDPFEIGGGEEDPLKEDDAKLFGEDDEEEDEDTDYDSFDDRDEF